MTRTLNPHDLWLLAKGLSAVAGRLEPREAAAVSGQAAAAITQAMTRTMDPNALASLAQALSEVAGRLEPKEAREAAATLGQAMTRTTKADALVQLAAGLSAVASRLEPTEAAAVCSRAATTPGQAMTKNVRDTLGLRSLAKGLLVVAGRLEPREAGEAAAALTEVLTRARNPHASGQLREGLSAVLLQEDSLRLARRRHHGVGAVGVLSSPGSTLLAAVLLRADLEPLPPPLPAQTLVDLLKQPFCVGEARRLVLDQLGRHYQRPFADQWDFVRFAQERRLSLDLLTPPRRPGAPVAER
jgi:hypothetical protein